MSTTTIVNPYWDAIKDKHVDDIYGIYRNMHLTDEQFREAAKMSYSRYDYCSKYSWSITDPTSVLFVAEHLGASAVEMGAGMGYYAWLLAQSGVDMLCYDIAPPDQVTDNRWHSPRKSKYEDFTGETRETYHPVLQGSPEILQHHTDRTLFLCWPPMSDMATLCLKHYHGRKLVSIGEGDGGCTADSDFFALLEKEWHEVAAHTPVQWDGIHDYIEVYERNH